MREMNLHRRPVQIPCTLRTARLDVEAVSTDVADDVIHLHVDRQHVPDVAVLSRGEQGSARLVPPEADPIELRTEIAEVDPAVHDENGRPVVRVSMRIVGADGHSASRLEGVLRLFRYTVAWVGGDQHEEVERLFSEQYRLLQITAGAAWTVLETNDVAALVVDSPSGPLPADFDEQVAVRSPFTSVIRWRPEGEDAAPSARAFFEGRKPYRLDELPQIVRRAVDASAMRRENQRLAADLGRANRRLFRDSAFVRHRAVGITGFEKIIGQSPKLRLVLAELDRIRESDVTVHVHGDTGTGKELVARALHDGGPRASGPFVVHNCAGMTESLAQSTLFGHIKGAFTGADQDKPGLFQVAHKGTLFLDEIGDLSPGVQASLLRALQNREIVPVGGSRPIHVDVRIISATNKSLRDETMEGRFRADLYFRLGVISVSLPTLRERKDDIPYLAQHFLDTKCELYGRDLPGFTAEAMDILESYPWPGNVRELENAIERAVVLARNGESILPEMLPAHIRGHPSVQRTDAPEGQTPGGGYDDALGALSRSLIERALRQSNGVVTHAATLLGIERTRLTRLIQRLGLAARGP